MNTSRQELYTSLLGARGDILSIRYTRLAERRKLYRQIWELKKQGVPVVELERQFKISRRTIHRIMENGGDWPKYRVVNPPSEDSLGKPVSQTSNGNGIKPFKGMSLAPKGLIWYFRACPRCSGDIEARITGEVRCIQCGVESRV